jgi:hypothetical protein
LDRWCEFFEDKHLIKATSIFYQVGAAHTAPECAQRCSDRAVASPATILPSQGVKGCSFLTGIHHSENKSAN